MLSEGLFLVYTAVGMEFVLALGTLELSELERQRL